MEDIKKQLTKRNVVGGSTLFFVLYILYRFQRLVAWQKKTSTICPGPKCDPLLGNINDMIEAGGFSEELFRKLHKEHGDVVRFYLGPTSLNLSVNDPELVSEVYRKCRERPHETYLFLWYLGKENLLFQRGPIVKEMRLRYGAMVAQRAQLEKLHHISFQRFRANLATWSSDSTVPVDAYEVLGPIIYDIMGSVLFDAPWLSTEEGREVYKLHKKLILEVNRWVLFPVGPIFHPAFVDYLLTIRKWRAVVGKLLDNRAKEMRANPAKFEEDTSAIHMILTSTNEDGTPFFTKERAISTMCGFLNGAYDTTHATAYWMVWNLAKTPRVQEKMLEEFMAVCGDRDIPTVEDIRNCEYLHAVVLESMRIRATVPVNQRVNDNEDVTIGDVTVPAGTNINIPNAVLYHEERFFGPDTDKFIPERFIGDSPSAVLCRKSWSAFGSHSRMCVGLTFALAEVKAMLHTLVTRSVITLENPADEGVTMIEAGVNQPKVHNRFYFTPRTPRRKAEEDNLKWWLNQTEALEKIKPAGGKVASMA